MKKKKHTSQKISSAIKETRVHPARKPAVSAITAPSRTVYFALATILLLTFLVFRPGLSNGFVLWDDDKYIQNNALIMSIDLKALFSGYVMGNYHPLTMLVYAIGYQLFGLDATGYHTISLLLHLSNVLLVFFAVFHLAGKSIVALVAALFFGIHPMHVESVAWASELKDLLYCFFFLASYIFYLRYLKEQQKKKFLYYSLFVFLLALLSKAMAVSLPLVLLLTDYFKERKLTRQTVLEKLPFFALAIVFGIVAVMAQKSLGATESTVFPWPQRFLFAGYAYLTYLVKLLFPFQLSSYYPYPVKPGASIPLLYYFYLPFVLALTACTIYFLRTSRKIIFGLGFFTATILLVLQLLPVGDTIMADRYTYIPSIGIFYLAGEGFYWLWNRNQKTVSLLLTAVFLIFFSVQTVARCRVWQDGLSLWNDVIGKYQIIPAAYYNRGIYFFNQNQDKEALSDFNKAIELKPDYADAYNNRGSVFLRQGKLTEALDDLSKAVLFNRNLAQAYFNRGYIYFQDKKYDEAYKDYTKVIELKPDQAQLAIVYNLRALLLMNQKKYPESLSDFNKAIELKPDFIQAFNNRGSLYLAQEKSAEAIRDFTTAIEMKNDYAEAYYNRGIAEFNSGNKKGGCQDWQRAAGLGNQGAAQAFQANCQ